MTDVRDDLLPGDADAILGELDRKSVSIWPETLTPEQIEGWKAIIADQQQSLFKPQMPKFNLDLDDHVSDALAYRWGTVIHRPHFANIAKVAA